MTDEQLEAQIFKAAKDCLLRYDQADKSTPNARDQALIAEFMSGMSLLNDFMLRADGAVNHFQMQRAIYKVGKKMGFRIGPAHLDDP